MAVIEFVAGAQAASQETVLTVRRSPVHCMFESLFHRRVEDSCDTGGNEPLGHYKDTYKPLHVVTSRTEAECWLLFMFTPAYVLCPF